jgi:hypothetical protein
VTLKKKKMEEKAAGRRGVKEKVERKENLRN